MAIVLQSCGGKKCGVAPGRSNSLCTPPAKFRSDACFLLILVSEAGTPNWIPAVNHGGLRTRNAFGVMACSLEGKE